MSAGKLTTAYNMKIVFVIAACLAASLVCLDAHPGGDRKGEGKGERREGGGKGNKTGNYKPNGTLSNWNRTTSSDVSVKETGFVKNGTPTAYVSSTDPALENLNYTKAKTIYFSKENVTGLFVAYVLYAPSPCFVGTSDRKFDDVKTEVEGRNKTVVSAAKQVILNATERLTDEEANDLKAHGLSLACGRRSVFRVVAVDNTTFQPPPNATVKVFFSLDSEVTLYFIQSPLRSGHNSGEQGERKGSNGGPKGKGGRPAKAGGRGGSGGPGGNEGPSRRGTAPNKH